MTITSLFLIGQFENKSSFKYYVHFCLCQCLGGFFCYLIPHHWIYFFIFFRDINDSFTGLLVLFKFTHVPHEESERWSVFTITNTLYFQNPSKCIKTSTQQLYCTCSFQQEILHFDCVGGKKSKGTFLLYLHCIHG